MVNTILRLFVVGLSVMLLSSMAAAVASWIIWGYPLDPPVSAALSTYLDSDPTITQSICMQTDHGADIVVDCDKLFSVSADEILHCIAWDGWCRTKLLRSKAEREVSGANSPVIPENLARLQTLLDEIGCSKGARGWEYAAFFGDGTVVASCITLPDSHGDRRNYVEVLERGAKGRDSVSLRYDVAGLEGLDFYVIAPLFAVLMLVALIVRRSFVG